MTNKNNIIIVSAVLIAAFAAVYILFIRGREKTVNAPVSAPIEEMDISTQPSESSSDLQEGSLQEETTSNSEIQEINVKGGSFYFEPKEINVKVGKPVRINFENAEGLHDFVIDEFNIATRQISTGQTDTVEFTPDKAGEFEYYCSVANHRAIGMFGRLIVEE